MRRREVVRARPAWKCPGGKTQLLPELLSRVPGRFNAYHEPFFGAGALFFELASRRRVRGAVLNDANPHVFHTLWAIKHNVEEVVARLRLAENTPEYFEAVRRVDPLSLDYVREAAWFIYLTKTAFNGLFRVNKSGRFNAPFGGYRNPTICDEANLRAVSRALANAELSGVDFERAPLPGAGDLWYADPPYPAVSKTANFSAYTADGFDWDDHVRLASHARKLKAAGVHVMVSNADLPRVRDLYRSLGFRVERVKARRNINSDGSKRGPVGELIIT